MLVDKIIKEAIDVGKVLFGSNKKAASIQNAEYEKNTPVEQKIFDELMWFVTENSRDIEKYLPELIKLKNKFPQILIPQNGSVYRGTIVKKNLFRKIIRKEGGVLNLPFKIEYKPTGNFTSWSYDKNVAKRFSKAIKHDEIPIIIKADVDNTFIFNYRFLDSLGMSEKETISIKKKFTCDLVWYEKF